MEKTLKGTHDRRRAECSLIFNKSRHRYVNDELKFPENCFSSKKTATNIKSGKSFHVSKRSNICYSKDQTQLPNSPLKILTDKNKMKIVGLIIARFFYSRRKVKENRENL